jgi:hypothetical protein
MMRCLVVAVLTIASAQNIGKQKKNLHLPLAVEECTASGCTSKQQGVVLDGKKWL